MIPVSEADLLKINALPPLREVINAHELRAEKSLGQNFLLDGNITDKIVSFVRERLDSSATVFEIGPGPGGLTRSILRHHAGKLIAIEFDTRAIQALQDLREAANARLELIHGDALRMDICTLAPAPRAVVANLPYNIATPLLIGWLGKIAANKDDIDIMALMFQKEVAERIVAQPATKAYGRLSVICQWLCQVQKVYDLPPSAFTPPPKVTSSIVRFIPKDRGANPPAFKTMEKITAAAFNQRRKMIRSSLKDYADAIEKAGLDPSLRAENLSVGDFIALASATEKL